MTHIHHVEVRVSRLWEESERRAHLPEAALDTPPPPVVGRMRTLERSPWCRSSSGCTTSGGMAPLRSRLPTSLTGTRCAAGQQVFFFPPSFCGLSAASTYPSSSPCQDPGRRRVDVAAHDWHYADDLQAGPFLSEDRKCGPLRAPFWLDHRPCVLFPSITVQAGMDASHEGRAQQRRARQH